SHWGKKGNASSVDATCTPFTMRLLLLLPNCRCAIRVPSGEYDGEFTRVPAAAVTTTVCVPDLSRAWILLFTPKPTTNAIFVPSGDQVGSNSSTEAGVGGVVTPPVFVHCVSAPVATSTSQMS